MFLLLLILSVASVTLLLPPVVKSLNPRLSLPFYEFADVRPDLGGNAALLFLTADILRAFILSFRVYLDLPRTLVKRRAFWFFGNIDSSVASL